MVGVFMNHATARIHRRRLCALENYWAGSDDWVLTGDLLEQRHFEARLPALRAQVKQLNACLPRSPPTVCTAATMRVDIIGHFKPCMTEIYLPI